MGNKRRMSVLAKERINQMDAKMPLRKGGKNANRMDLSAFGKKKKTKRKKKKEEKKEEMEEKERKPKQSGTSLLAQDEIEKLTRERTASDAKRRSRKKKKVELGSGDEAMSPRKSRKKSRNGKKK